VVVRLANANPDPGEVRLPRLSIIIPTLNESGRIGAALQALRDGPGNHLELIVADGGSTDGTARMAAEHADRVVCSQCGRAAQMNAGAAAASGDILLFLHADASLPRRYKTLLTEGFWHSARDWGRFDLALGGGPPMFRLIECLINLRSRLTGIATGDQAIFVRRTLFRKMGGFAPLPLMEDIELSIRLKRFTRPYCIRDRVIASSRRWEREGILRTIFLMWYLRIAYWAGRDPAILARRYYPSR
jgi:rSAM/selenodomain-associated transferase 2